MFKTAPANPYDDIVGKATDETLTSENWELILNLCDKVQEEGEQGARNVIAAILKRLAHRNPNVQLYSLTLAESLSKNCTKELHSEIASRAFTQALERIITDRTTHDKVRNRTLMLVAMWTEDFENDPNLGIMEECYQGLKAKNYKFEHNDEPPPSNDEEARRREEEELQRVLELSIQDKGGRRNWNEYSLASSSGAGGSGSQASTQATAKASTAPHPHPQPAPPSSSSSSATAPSHQSHSSGYVPSTESHAQTTMTSAAALDPPSQPSPAVSTSPAPSISAAEIYAVTRVRALHSFEPTEPNELAFEKGDIIKVVNREYKDWWRGQLRNRTGIFPVNYVEPLPEPTPAELAAEAQQEAAVFSQAANVDRLLTMLRALDPAKDNLADNEEIQELYRSCMTLRPKIVKLIDKYSQKRADLVSMNESFVRARTIFDRMMEESLARHSEFYDQQRPAFLQPQSSFPQPESRLQGQQALSYGRPVDQPQAYAYPGVYDQAGYGVYTSPSTAYSQSRQGGPIPDPRVNLARSSSYGARQLQGQLPSQAQQAPQSQPQTAYVQPYPAQDSSRASYYPQSQLQQAEAPLQTQSSGQPPALQQPPVQSQPQLHQTPSQLSVQSLPETQSGVPQQQPQVHTQTPHQPAETHGDVQSQPQPHPQSQPQQQQAQQQRTLAGPPFVYDPTLTYPDQNVQAWAQYYAQGGTDPTGSVYFISVPGITDGPQREQEQQQQQQQQQQQPAAFSATAFSGAGPGSSPEFIAHAQRQSSLPNPYGPSSPTVESAAGPASAGPGGPTGVGARAPWETTSSLSGQFAQMRVGEPSVGA
ncbi:hypothetical protein F5148DRAFT_1209321 [Russula earlei]|uniref:Uncharacterized protein n=1 Tax=Russula earlei TaxID=71964 RepID=A0ACC0U5I7_9AGAM|nr:hypothetical protein F5148DRAFT_1209321 [Russula earlei]